MTNLIPSPDGPIIQSTGQSIYSVGSTAINPAQEEFKQNRSFHPHLTGNPVQGNLRRGKLVRRDANNRRVGLLHFVFNPESVSYSYDINIDDIAVEDVGANDTPFLGPAITCSFSLVFDRTYEVLYDRNSPGVLDDVAVLEHILGSKNVNGTTTAPVGLPVSVYFGSDRSMSFGGIITGASVTMTHFTAEMVPVRLGMNITMLRMKEADSQVAQLSDTSQKGADDVLFNYGSGGGAQYTYTPSGSSGPSSSGSSPASEPSAADRSMINSASASGSGSKGSGSSRKASGIGGGNTFI